MKDKDQVIINKQMKLVKIVLNKKIKLEIEKFLKKKVK